MNDTIEAQTSPLQSWRPAAAVALVLLAIGAAYRAWIDIGMIAYNDPEQSQVILALPAVVLLVLSRRDKLAGVVFRSALQGILIVAVGWGMSWYGYMNAVQSFWHMGAVLMVVGVIWSVLGNRVMLILLPAVIVMGALVPVPNLLRQDIALPLQRMAAIAAEFVLVAMGAEVERNAQSLVYKGKPVTVEEACNGMRMIFALLLVSWTFVMTYRLNTFARIMLIAISPLLAVLCNIIRIVPSVIIYGEYGDEIGQAFHDISGWAMIFVAALMLFGLMRLLTWAEISIYAPPTPPGQQSQPAPIQGQKLPGFVAPVCCALVLAAAAVQSSMLPSAADARPYHEAILQVAENTPIQVEGLKHEPMEIPQGSLDLLRANYSRAVQYTDERLNSSCMFLLIQSRDARDLDGHYPPRCYPHVSGYVEKNREAREWAIDGMTIRGMEYTFAESDEPGAPRWVIMHFFVLPGSDAPEGGTTGNLSKMRQAAADYLRRHFGAAQVQLLFRETSATRAQRDAIFKRIMNAHAGLLQTILAGPEKSSP